MRPFLAMLIAGSLFTQAETIEEARLPRATAAMPGIADAFNASLTAFQAEWAKASDARSAFALVQRYGHQLWQDAKSRIHTRQDVDDRPLYWARLAFARTLRDTQPGFPIFAADREQAIDLLEQTSRGMDDVTFPSAPNTLRVLVTGFDPFLLDRHLDQSNPSGVNALLLDGDEFEVIDPAGTPRRVHIETAVFPVRMADFDTGMVERFLKPWMAGPEAMPHDWLDAARANAGTQAQAHARPQVDMVITVSMGRSDFDLERFPGLRRSAAAPDNVNAYTSGSRDRPVLPNLNGRPLPGAEFVEFSLPAKAMLAIQAPYAVHDNRWVRVAPDTRFAAGGLATLWGKTAVEGSGGGYYSNEISYRAVRLRDELGLARLPVGHIHTPAIPAFDVATLQAITRELHALLAAAAATVPLQHAQ